MFDLFNRITWVLCISLGIIICSFGDGFILGGIIIAIAVKYIIFSPEYIQTRLEFFQKQLFIKPSDIEEKETSFLESEEQEQLQSEINQQKEAPIELEFDETQEEIIPENNEVQEDILEDNEVEVIEEDEDEDDFYIGTAPAYAASNDTSNKEKVVREPNIFEKFFAENLLAKVGGIFVFLGVLFLLGLVYTMIGPITKLILGFIVGGICYGSGVWLDKKGYIEESRIVLGIALLINYLVILWGRYYLGSDDSSSSTILSVAVTFFFLICNTILAIYTSHVYNSRPLLIFAFVVAYINPFLLGESSSEPYTLLGYTMIVTFGAMIMSYRKKDEVLFPLSFVFAAILILIAPWSDGSGWITKLLCINTLGAMGLYVSTVFKKKYMYAFEILISGTFFLIGFMGILGGEILSPMQYIVMGASSLGLMAFCYSMMHRGVYLYSIGTVGTILTLTPVLLQNGMLEGSLLISTLIVIVFGVMNIGISLVRPKKLLAENIGNTISGLVSGGLFLIFMIFIFGNQYFPGTVQGLCFFGLSGIYALVTYILANSIGIKNISINKDYENLIYSIFSLGVSLFTLAVAFIFAEQKEVVSIAWLLEANVLLYLASRIKSIKVVFVGIVLFVIGIVKFIDFTQLINLFPESIAGNYGLLVTFVIIFASLVLNLVFITTKKDDGESYLTSEFVFAHNFFHIIAIISLLLWGHEILGITDNWYSLSYYSIFIMFLGVIYEKLGTNGLQKTHLSAYLAVMGAHILLFFSDVGTDDLRFILSSCIALIYSLPFIYKYIKGGDLKNDILFTVFLGYLLTLSSLYLYHIFNTTAIVTVYWAGIVFAYISYNYQRKELNEKTLMLYIAPMAIIGILLHQTPEVGTVMLFLASLMVMFYAHRLKSLHNSVLGLIFLISGVFSFIIFVKPVQDVSMIISGFIIAVSMITSLIFSTDSDESTYLNLEFIWTYNITHIIGMIALSIWGHEVLGITNDWFSLLYYSIIVMSLGVVYEKISGEGLQKTHLATYILMMGMHLILFAENLNTDAVNLSVSTFVVGIYSLPFIYDYIVKGKIENKQLFVVFLSYLFMLSTLYIYQIFSVTFMVTLYWGLLAFGILWYGIAKDVLFMRTIGLYLITLTASKVFLYDIWMSVDDTVSRVVALIVVGILMIVLSTMYTKKYGNNLNSEFSPSNLFPKNNLESHKKYSTSDETSNETKNSKTKVQADIEDIDISGINSIKLHFNNEEKPTNIRAENLIKIAKLISNTYKKTEFKPGELKKAYTLIEEDYKTSLSPAQHKKLKKIITTFVDKGGSIEFIK